MYRQYSWNYSLQSSHILNVITCVTNTTSYNTHQRLFVISFRELSNNNYNSQLSFMHDIDYDYRDYQLHDHPYSDSLLNVSLNKSLSALKYFLLLPSTS